MVVVTSSSLGGFRPEFRIFRQIVVVAGGVAGVADVASGGGGGRHGRRDARRRRRRRRLFRRHFGQHLLDDGVGQRKRPRLVRRHRSNLSGRQATTESGDTKRNEKQESISNDLVKVPGRGRVVVLQEALHGQFALFGERRRAPALLDGRQRKRRRRHGAADRLLLGAGRQRLLVGGGRNGATGVESVLEGRGFDADGRGRRGGAADRRRQRLVGRVGARRLGAAVQQVVVGAPRRPIGAPDARRRLQVTHELAPFLHLGAFVARRHRLLADVLDLVVFHLHRLLGSLVADVGRLRRFRGDVALLGRRLRLLLQNQKSIDKNDVHSFKLGSRYRQFGRGAGGDQWNCGGGGG